MTLKEAKENYPIYDTIAGFYDCQQTFKCNNVKQIENIENWSNPPLPSPQEGYFNFIRYMGDNEFECWTFAYYRVSGYLTLDEYDNFIPMVYSEDFGWEEADPGVENGLYTVFAPEEFGKSVTAEQVAEAFDPEAYADGYIFFSPEEIINFVKRGE